MPEPQNPNSIQKASPPLAYPTSHVDTACLARYCTLLYFRNKTAGTHGTDRLSVEQKLRRVREILRSRAQSEGNSEGIYMEAAILQKKRELAEGKVLTSTPQHKGIRKTWVGTYFIVPFFALPMP